MADDKVVYQRVGREMRLASNNSWTQHRMKHLSWRSRWIILCTLDQRENGSFVRNLTSWLVPFWLVSWLSTRSSMHCYAPNAVYRCLVARQFYPSCGFSSADYRCFQVSDPCRAIHSTAFVHHTASEDRDFKKIRIASFCKIFMILFNFTDI